MDQRDQLSLIFFSAHFPKFEVYYDKEKNILTSDNIFVISLLFYYACVLEVASFFQESCKGLDAPHQEVICRFFKCLKEFGNAEISKDVLRNAIRDAVPPSPHLKFISSNILKTPDKIHSPSPSKLFFQEKSRELQRVKTMLENERYERSMLEVEVKQNEERIQLLRKLALHARFWRVFNNVLYF